jgi:hypothetical protein
MTVIDFGLDYTRFVYNGDKYKARPTYLEDGSRSTTDVECYIWVSETLLTGEWMPCLYPLYNIEAKSQRCILCGVENISIYPLEECRQCNKKLYSPVKKFSLY